MAVIERHRRNATAPSELLGMDLRAWGAMLMVPLLGPVVGFGLSFFVSLAVVVVFGVAGRYGMSVGVLYLKLRHKLRGRSLDCEGFYYWKEFRNRR